MIIQFQAKYWKIYATFKNFVFFKYAQLLSFIFVVFQPWIYYLSEYSTVSQISLDLPSFIHIKNISYAHCY